MTRSESLKGTIRYVVLLARKGLGNDPYEIHFISPLAYYRNCRELWKRPA